MFRRGREFWITAIAELEGSKLTHEAFAQRAATRVLGGDAAVVDLEQRGPEPGLARASTEDVAASVTALNR